VTEPEVTGYLVVSSERMRIVVTEYPKSGGSWLVSMLGSALLLPKRDIYVGDGFALFDIRKHPWYEHASSYGLPESCVIKSHELPGSSAITFPAQFVHMVRDGRDVVVSKYFFEKEFCVLNGIYERFDISFDDYVLQVAKEWRNYVFAWLEAGTQTHKYEDFLRDPVNALQTLIAGLDRSVSEEQIAEAVGANTKEKFSRSLDKAFKYNTFVRKATAGDWRNYFTDEHVRAFKCVAGDALVRLGYERNAAW
jgi:hypothetical protein